MRSCEFALIHHGATPRLAGVNEWVLSHWRVHINGSYAMTTLAAIAWGLSFATLACVVNLCIISTIRGEPPREEE